MGRRGFNNILSHPRRESIEASLATEIIDHPACSFLVAIFERPDIVLAHRAELLIEHELALLAQKAERHRLDQGQTHKWKQSAQRDVQADQCPIGMSDEVDGTTGMTDHSFDNLCLSVHRGVGWRPAFPCAAIAGEARRYCPETAVQPRDHTAPGRPGRPRSGHEYDGRACALLAIVNTSVPILQHLHLLAV